MSAHTRAYGKMLKEKQKLTERERFWYPLYRNNEYIFCYSFLQRIKKESIEKLFLSTEKKRVDK